MINGASRSGRPAQDGRERVGRALRAAWWRTVTASHRVSATGASAALRRSIALD